MRPKPTDPSTITAIVLLFLFAASPLAAQTIRGSLVEQTTESPVSGAVVVLLSTSGEQVASTLTDETGQFLLHAPEPGSYRVEAERIGYTTTSSRPIQLGAGETREYRLTASTEAIALGGIVARGERRCTIRPQEGLQVYTLWNEARKALSATALAEDQQRVRYDVTLYERRLNPYSLVVEDESRRAKSQVAVHPFRTPYPAEQISEHGYVRATGEDTLFLAPDAQVLLSDAFLDDHCFRIESDEAEPELIGLAFEPVRGRKPTDISGVLWLERRSAELKSLEYQYTRLPWAVPASKLGGRVEFDRLPTGRWIVHRWWIRMPEVRITARDESRLPGGRLSYRQESLIGIKEEGGEVTDVVGTGQGFAGAQRASLVGMVWDSTASAPLAGATVFLSGTQHSATTDALGRFRMSDVPGGEYHVAFMHDRLDEVSLLPAPRAVRLAPDSTAVVNLALPPLITTADDSEGTVRIVSRQTGAGEPAHLEGVVTDAAGRPLNAARIEFPDLDRGVRVDATGRFRATGLPAGTHTAEARQIGYQPKQFTLELNEGETVEFEVALDVEPINLAGVEATARARTRTVTGQLAGFYERREKGFGHFLDRVEIERHGSAQLADVFRTVPGMNIRCADFARDCLVFLQATPSPMDGETFRGECPVQYFIDGIPEYVIIRSPGELPVVNPISELQSHEIEGIEIYRPAEVPVQFNRGRNARCGVIAIWTRRHLGSSGSP